MKMRAGAPSSRAAHATAWPWLPALAATTPAASRSGSRLESLTYAPRILNEPVRCRFSAFKRTGRPASRDSVSDGKTGVTRATPSSRSRARSISGSPGAVAVAIVDSEHLLEYLPYRRQRVELPRLHLGEQPPQLGVVRHRLLEVAARPARSDREDLAREIGSAPLLELPALLEKGAVLLDLLPQLRHVLPAHRLGEDDRRIPLAAPLPMRTTEREDRAHLVQHRLGSWVVHLVDRDHVRDLHDPRLQRLHRVARARHEHEEDGVDDPDHLDLALPRADRLEEDDVLAGRVEHEQRLQRRLGEPAEVPSRPHRADEDLGVEEVVAEPDPVAEQRAVRERARGVDRDDAHRDIALPDVPDQRRDEARLPDAGRTGDPDRIRGARLRIEVGDDAVCERVAVLHERDRACERAPVALPDAGGKVLASPVAPSGHGPESIQFAATTGACSRWRYSSSAGASPPSLRARSEPASAAATSITPQAAQIQRGPVGSRSSPPSAFPTPRRAYVKLITNVSARPRIRSKVPRCTRSALQAIATPFPIPVTKTQQEATQMFGLTAAAR